MDNADLETFSVSPGKLSPKFHPSITEYTVTVSSDVKEIKLDPLTSDCGASYTIKGGDGGKTVPLKEGEVTSIKVEVTAEDGSTIKNYFTHVTRLSASDASLTGIKLSSGDLFPAFDAKLTNYSANVSCCCDSLCITPLAADKKTAVKVNGLDAKEVVALNYGETRVSIDVTSPNQTNTQTYVITVCRQEIVRYFQFVDSKLNQEYECPVCLRPCHRPKSIAGSNPKHIFCKSCIEELTRTSKVDPLDETPLKGEWKMDELEMESKMAGSEVLCTFSYHGCTEKMPLKNLGGHIKQCEFRVVQVDKSGEMTPHKNVDVTSKGCTMPCPDCNRPVRSSELDIHKSYMCTTKHTYTIDHKVEVRQWEKRLRQETGEQSVDKLAQTAEDQVKFYYKSLPQHGCAGQFKGDVSPLRYLEIAAEWYATAIRVKPKDAKLHFSLAQVLEEQFYCEDLYGIKPQKTADFDDLDFNSKSKESSMEDDIQALCEMRGVGRSAPFAAQLKAIDAEYHHLLDQGQSDKADYVQKLYAWKSKQATQGGKTCQSASTEETALGKAYIKYLDALSCGSDNHLYSFHVGRLMLVQHKPEEAVKRLDVAVGLKPTHLESRFILGLALCKQKGGPAKRKAEALGYLAEGLEILLNQMAEAQNTKEGSGHKDRTALLSDALLRPDSVLCVQGVITLADQLTKTLPTPPGIMPAADVCHYVVHIATRVLSQLVSRGDTYHQLEWLALEGRSSLLQMLLEIDGEKSEEQNDAIKRYCDNLSALIKCSTVPTGAQLLELQEKTCQQGVVLQPCNSQALYRLGDAQLCFFDNDSSSPTAKRFLQEAEQSFRASIEQEGKPCDGGAVPAQVSDQLWFKERQTQKDAANQTQKAAATQKTPQRGGAGAAVGRGNTPAARGGAASRGRGGTARGGAGGKSNAVPTRSGPAAAAKAPTSSTVTRGRTSPVKGATSGRGTGRGAGTTAKVTAAVKSAASNHKTGICTHTAAKPPAAKPPQATAAKLQPAKLEETKSSTSDKPVGPPNKPTHQARLGLARVLARKADDMSECYSLYEQVLTMAPDVHDAYIELADLLVKTEPMKAVDVYIRYPFPEVMTFDDAYIQGEIVRILMKQEKYDDPRLGPSLIALGKVMGLTVIEKYVDALDKTFKYSKLLKEVYAGVNGKDVDDPDLQQFFKFKCWI